MTKTLALVFVLVSAAFAQNAPIPTLPFSFTANAVSLPGAGKTFAGVDAGVQFFPTQKLAIAQHNIVSADGSLNYFGAGLDYSLPVISLGINNMEPTLSGFRFLFSVGGSAGTARATIGSAPTVQHVGGELHGSFSYSLTSTGSWQLGFRAGAARFPGYQSGWTPLITIGPSFKF